LPEREPWLKANTNMDAAQGTISGGAPTSISCTCARATGQADLRNGISQGAPDATKRYSIAEQGLGFQLNDTSVAVACRRSDPFLYAADYGKAFFIEGDEGTGSTKRSARPVWTTQAWRVLQELSSRPTK
jgi:hypothetical protein